MDTFAFIKKTFKIMFYNCLGMKMNITQADGIDFIMVLKEKTAQPAWLSG